MANPCNYIHPQRDATGSMSPQAPGHEEHCGWGHQWWTGSASVHHRSQEKMFLLGESPTPALSALALLQQWHFPATGSQSTGDKDLYQPALPAAAAPNQRVSLQRKRWLGASCAARTVAPNINGLLSRRNTGKVLTASLFPKGAARTLTQWIIPGWEIKYLKRKKGKRSSEFTVFKAAFKAHKLTIICQVESTWRSWL